MEASLFSYFLTVTVTDTHGVEDRVPHGGRGPGVGGARVLSLEAAETEQDDDEASVNSGHHDHWTLQ